ncbi:MAG: hypothetical protein NT062_10395 [Proteobacteria bacterium]|nr:hypothetical protein [Pseudomonadota bacterium]
MILVSGGCGSKPTSHDDAAPIPRTPMDDCVARFDATHATLAPFLVDLGIRETAATARTRAPNVAALRGCAQNAPHPTYVWFDGGTARAQLFGDTVTPADNTTRIAALAGRYAHPAPAGSLDDSVVWTIGADGTLVVERTPAGPPTKTTRPTTEPPHQLAFTRARQLAIATTNATGTTSRQFVPAFVDGAGDLYLSFTSGAMAIPLASPLVLGDADRWIVRRAEACTLVDAQRGASPIPCRLERDRFVVTLDGSEQVWPRRGDVLLHPAMERFARVSPHGK